MKTVEDGGSRFGPCEDGSQDQEPQYYEISASTASFATSLLEIPYQGSGKPATRLILRVNQKIDHTFPMPDNARARNIYQHVPTK